MNESKKFSFRNDKWQCLVELFPDRIEYSWDERGLGVDKGRRTFQSTELALKLSEYSGASRLTPSSGRLPGIYLVLAMFSYALLPLPWRYSTWVFVAFFVLSAISVVKRLRRHEWLQILTVHGQVAVSVRVSDWTADMRREFRHAYDELMKVPNSEGRVTR